MEKKERSGKNGVETPLLRVGTSGYSYTEWTPAGFYPNGTKSPDMLGVYAREFTIYDTDPDTASAWTESGVNALKLGVEVTA